MKILFVTVSFYLSQNFIFAQSNTWEYLYHVPNSYDNSGRDLCMSDGNNFFIVGYATVGILQERIVVLKLTQNGDTLWTKILEGNGIQEGYSMVSSGDGGCVLTGYSDSSFTTKLDSQGNIIWNKFYGGYVVQALDIKRTRDGGYIACGRESYKNGVAFKIDIKGNLIWKKIYYSSDFINYHSIEEAIEDNGYILTGTRMTFPGSIITRIDSIGNVLWEKPFTVLNRDASGEVITKQQDYYTIGGTTSDTLSRNQIFILKIDKEGKTIFEKVFSTDKFETFYSMDAINLNRYIISYTTDSSNSNSRLGVIIITDSIGNLLSRKTFTSDEFIILRSILIFGNGDFLFGGTYSGNPNNYIVIAKTDSLLNGPNVWINTSQSSNVINEFTLDQNFPNPFNSSTIISFNRPDMTNKNIIQTSLIIYNSLGKVVSILINEGLFPGQYKIKFDGTNLSSGIYFYQLTINNKIKKTKKMCLIK